MNFSEFPLAPELLKNIEVQGFATPTEIQATVLPPALEGNDIAGIAKTGTGKTAAFLIPVIQQLIGTDKKALCLSPTRELASQIENQAMKLVEGIDLTTANLIGGMPQKEQIRCLREGAQLIIGTPGRVIDMVKERHLDLNDILLLVFDEADRMFDMGFLQDMRYILQKVNRKRQILLFSATMNFSVQDMVYEFGANPIEFNLSRDTLTAEGIKQIVYHVGDDEKASMLIGLCRKHLTDGGGMIVFVNYKDKVEWVTQLLNENGYKAKGLSSLLRQDQRTKILSAFRSGDYQALVATDVASRGIDVDDVHLVINYHLPEESSNYVHRIGRTARAGRKGMAIAIAGPEDAYNHIRIEELLGYKIPTQPIEDDDLAQDVVLPKYSRDRKRSMDSNTTSSKSRGDRSGGRGGKRGQSRGKDNRGDRNARSRGGNSDRNDRNDRSDRGDRNQQRQDRPDRDRGERNDRSARSDRNDRNDRGDSKNNRRGRRGGRGRSGKQGGGRRDREASNKPVKDLFPDATNLPSPITGNPVIYNVETGEAKGGNGSTTDSGLLKRFGSRVGSIFGSKK